jgi:hypothetical protein
MIDPIVPPDELIDQWVDDWRHSAVNYCRLEHYLARRGAIWAQYRRVRSLLEQAREELDSVGLHEALGDFNLTATRRVVELYGSDL